MGTCKICGRGPARELTFRRHTGMLVLQRDVKYQAVLCREHGLQVGKEALRKTLVFGWWGIISFFWNFYDVILDISSLSKARALGEPQGAPAPAPSPFLKPEAAQVPGQVWWPPQEAPAAPPPPPSQPPSGGFTG